MLVKLLGNRKAAIAWNFEHLGRVIPSIAPPQEIKTIEHKIWQVPNIPIPKALQDKMTEMLQDRLKRGTLERCDKPYRNP